MKLTFTNEDEAWFWLWNDDTAQWECWYEVDDTPAARCHKMDRPTAQDVTFTITDMIAAIRAWIN
jgi:hypothetical protein